MASEAKTRKMGEKAKFTGVNEHFKSVFASRKCFRQQSIGEHSSYAEASLYTCPSAGQSSFTGLGHDTSHRNCRQTQCWEVDAI